MHGLIREAVLSGPSLLAQLFNEESDLERQNYLFKFTQAFGKAKNSLDGELTLAMTYKSGNYSY